MKKGVFTIMNYLMPKQGVLSMHCSATQARDGSDTSILFGLSGTGKTTLSADPKRLLIGDDEHCWSDHGIFNIEGGCYAKVIKLSKEQEPDIWNALAFGAVLENVVYEPSTHLVDYNDTSITENTRGSYILDTIPNAKLPAVGGHPKNVIFLTADAFGVLPPVSKLTPGAGDVPLHLGLHREGRGHRGRREGSRADVLARASAVRSSSGTRPSTPSCSPRSCSKHGAQTWLVNTGWSGGAYGIGSRIKLKYTRAIIDAIHSGALDKRRRPSRIRSSASRSRRRCPEVPAELLPPRNTWADKAAYDDKAKKVAKLFRENFKKYEAQASAEVRAGGPKIA